MKSIWLAAVAFLPIFLYGQDNHYESLQLGSRNSVLTGAGVSRWQDQTAVFMNPATLINADYKGITFNTAAIGLNNISFTNGVGKGYDLKSSNFRFLPALVGGDFRAKGSNDRLHFGYAIYHRNRDDLRFTARAEYEANVINETESPGNENYVGQYSIDKSFDETVAVFGLGYKLSDRWSIGGSLQGIYMSSNLIESFNATIITNPAVSPTVDVVSTNEYFNTRVSKAMLQLKLGLAYAHDGWSFGLTMSTPTIGVFGTGEIDANINLNNIRLKNFTNRRSIFASARLDKLKATYKYPVSFSVGAGKQLSKFYFYGNLSAYMPIEKYVMLDPGNVAFIRPATSDNVLNTPNFLQVWSVNRFVMNGAAGFDWQFREKTRLLMSYALDQHYSETRPDDAGYQLPRKIWNLHHVNTGIQLSQARSEWIIGLQTSFGGDPNFQQPTSFDGPTEDGFLQGKRTTGEVRSTNVGLIVSYSLKFGQKK